jgi:hypothetical protein
MTYISKGFFMNNHNGLSILNWKHYEDQAKKMTDAQLLYSIEDCKKAESSAPDYACFPCKASSFYSDEKHVYVGELNRRRKGR